jgi:TolB protein
MTGQSGLRLIVLLVATCLAPVAKSELRIDITQGAGQAVPIAVVPFGWEGSGTPSTDVSGLVAADLTRTGRFAPIPETDMLQLPTTGAEVDFGDWRILGIEVVIVGRLTGSGPDSYMIQFQVFDVFRGEQLLGYRLPSTGAALRASAHRVSDMIYEKLTGIRGVAGTQIAYVNVLGEPGAEVFRLIVSDSDGENARVMVESADPIMSPAWSPDGRKLAYVSFERGHSEIYVQVLRTGARQRVSGRSGVNSAPAWSPDGRLLALTLSKLDGNLDIYTLDLSNQVLRRLTDNPSIDTEASWSGDGRSICFTSDRSGGPQIYRVSANGGRPQRLTFEGDYNARPRVSPDDQNLAVVHNDRGSYRIAVVEVARAYLQVLTDGHLDESPSFAPNGETLIYATREGGRGLLAAVSIDGRIRQRISSVEGDVREPAWSPFPLN